MADPTLVSNVTPYTGFTLDQITERLLAARGMTLDSTTGRVVATSGEQTDAYNRVRRAFSLLSTRFPSIFSIQQYSVAWTAGNTMIALPASIRDIVYVSFDGRQLRPLTRIKYLDIIKAADSGGGYKVTGEACYYRVAGFSDEGVSPATDYRIVLEIIPNPDSASTDTLIVGYNSKAPALPRTDSDDGAVTLPVNEPLQEWILRRAQELWAVDASDTTSRENAEAERLKIEMDLDEMLEANLEYPDVAIPDYPTLPEYSRDERT